MSTSFALIMFGVNFVLCLALSLAASYKQRHGAIRTATVLYWVSKVVFVFCIVFAIRASENWNVSRAVEIVAVVALSILLLAGAINGILTVRHRRR